VDALGLQQPSLRTFRLYSCADRAPAPVACGAQTVPREHIGRQAVRDRLQDLLLRAEDRSGPRPQECRSSRRAALKRAEVKALEEAQCCDVLVLAA